MDEKEEARAKELFFRYEGSQFYMSREGADAEYSRFQVPAEIEAAWLEEMTLSRLRGLDAPGNWKVVHFLSSHQDFRHLDAVLGATPMGEMWERCAYVEQLISWMKEAEILELASSEDIRVTLESAEQKASELADSAQSDESRQRIERVFRDIEAMKEEQERGGFHADSQRGWWTRLLQRFRNARTGSE